MVISQHLINTLEQSDFTVSIEVPSINKTSFELPDTLVQGTAAAALIMQR